MLEAAPPTLVADPFPFGIFAFVAERSFAELRVNDYDDIASVYDAAMAIDFHDATHPMRRDVAISIATVGPLRCVDLCCGSGLFLSRLAKDRTITGWGFDRSPNQIALARARALGEQIVYQTADVCEAQIPEEADLVSINFDALNHIGSVAQWRALFARIHQSLAKEGKLLFDINLPERLASDWDSPEVIVKEDLVYIHMGETPSFEGDCIRRRTPMVIFKRDPSGLYRQHEARIEQLAMPLGTVMSMLRDVGFSRVDVIREEGPSPRGHIFNKHRAFLLAGK
jgi:SAM-dependent methyltransferase